jgi:hypothetical protein
MKTIKTHEKCFTMELRTIQNKRTQVEELMSSLEEMIERNELYIKQIRHAIKTGTPAFDRETYLKLSVVKP